jgi:hypothetical protein
MQQYIAKQNPKEDRVVAGFYIKAKVVEVDHEPKEKAALNKQGVYQLRLELPIQMPIDQIEYHAKLEYPTVNPMFFTNFELLGEFYAVVTVFAPNEEFVPSEVLVYGLTPVLFRGIPQVVDVVLPQPPRTKKGKKK